jgi:hypothetical protein
MITITLTGGDHGGITAEVTQAGDRVRIASRARDAVYEAREVEDPETGEISLVGVFVGLERRTP